MAEVDGICEKAMNLLERLVAVEKESEEDNEENLHNFDEPTIQNLTNCMEYFVSANLRRERIEAIYAHAMENIQNVETADEASRIVSNYEKEIKGLTKISATNDKRYCDFVETLAPGDEDIRTVKSALSLIDPISKQQMVDPVKNKVCGHSYEKSVVFELIAKNPKTRCPMMGCTASFIKKSDLIPDVELKRMLEKKAARRDSTIVEDSNIVSLDETV